MVVDTDPPRLSAAPAAGMVTATPWPHLGRSHGAEDRPANRRSHTDDLGRRWVG
jgi:hypothetical protein